MEYFIQQCQVAISSGGGLLISLFLGGVVGSFGHCTGMCGPIVMVQTSARQTSEASSRLQRATRSLLLSYHLGRTLTYILMGVVGASLSQFMVGTPYHRWGAAFLLIFAGSLFISKAFSLSVPVTLKLGQVPLFRYGMRGYGRLVSTIAAPFGQKQDGGNLFFFGVMLGFLPCGLVMAAVFAVAATGNPLLAAAGMALFSLGTMPVLASFGIGAAFAQRRWPEQVGKLTNYVMALSGFFLCAAGLRLAL